jgi:CheY-like chemotaxis protein
MARILVFEDDATSRAILSACLTKAGHDVKMMGDGGAVIRSIREFDPDLVIMDILMPGLTGDDVYQTIRKGFGSSLPIIVSSCTAMRLKINNDPLLAHCPKPIDAAGLLETVQKLVSANSGSG